MQHRNESDRGQNDVAEESYDRAPPSPRLAEPAPAPAPAPATGPSASPLHADVERAPRRDLVTRGRIDQRKHLVLRAVQVVDYLFYLLYALLGIRFVLTLLGANPSAGFAQFINGITQP
ncbi:MAG TPA: hypothetical protein VK911_10750, partial [Vicinamibacterales bacterium]|nr:hypothetical protein [Vicinamibacterales bacterium]